MNARLANRFVLAVFVAVSCTFSPTKAVDLPEAVKAAVSQASSSSYVDLLLSFDNDLDLTALKMSNLRTKPDKTANYRNVMGKLLRSRDDLRLSIEPTLAQMKQAGQVESYKFFTVSRTVLVRTRAGNVANLMTLPGIRLINVNEAVSLIEPVQQTPATAADATLANNALNAINVRSLWNHGLTGAGRLICSFDTGINGTHPALASKWRGNHGAAAAACWFAPHVTDSIPNDNVGHGSHVMGIMVGSTATDTIGVAPGAQWISAAVIDQGVSFSATIADILSAFDWVLDPDGDTLTTSDVPDVICNSWGVPKGVFGSCDNTFWQAIDNVEAAGIVTIFAAGNEGPNAMTMRNPGDRASSPLNTLSVGAIDPTTDVVADFSSRGPATCDGVSIKPELVAPGVNIYSSYKDGTYHIMSGTSMAAPFVAGLVALMRQYNPDATVEEIKTALMASAQDLGPVGEDNSYGNGLIDASKILSHLGAPIIPSVEVANYAFRSGGDSFADPGETASLYLTFQSTDGLADSIDVHLASLSSTVALSPDTLRYHFTTAGYAINLDSFTLQVSSAAISGQNIQLLACLSLPGTTTEDTLYFSVLIGHAVPGVMSTVTTGGITFTVSDFGQYGLGTGSIYQAGGDGFRLNGGSNLLYEAGLIVSAGGQLVSDAIRSDKGGFKETEFVPAASTASSTASDQKLEAGFSDGNAPLPIPVQIDQTVYQTGKNFVIISFDVYNPSPERLSQLSIGLFCDFDIDQCHDVIGFDTALGMIYQYDSAASRYVGLIGVSPNEFSFAAGINDNCAKEGFTKSQKSALVSGSGISIEPVQSGDWYMAITRTAEQVEAFGKRTLALAVVAATSPADLRTQAEAALAEYGNLLTVDGGSTPVPRKFCLSQNFPNPFNPETTIRFQMASQKQAVLSVYNVTGQKVRTLFDGPAKTGETTVVWDGRDDGGMAVASGIYFYRLTAGSETITKKMALLK